MNEDTLDYPANIKDEIGLGVNQINALKKQGCPFIGRKTSVRWVRQFLSQLSGAESSPAPRGHQQRSGANKSGGRAAKND